MTARLAVVCSHLTKARVFADIGCDHGYCTEYMLANGLCERAYISDISAQSLKKAENLLKIHVESGRCIPVCADGLDGIGEPCDLVLIAGMGGEETVKILSRGNIPLKFVLQPMKNSEKVRRYLVEHGAKIECDYTFADGKFYDLIAGYLGGGDFYNELEFRYGRGNLLNPSKAFFDKLSHDADNYRMALTSVKLTGARRDGIRRKLYELEVITDAIKGNI